MDAIGRSLDARRYRVVGTESHVGVADGTVLSVVRAAILHTERVVREGEVVVASAVQAAPQQHETKTEAENERMGYACRRTRGRGVLAGRRVKRKKQRAKPAKKSAAAGKSNKSASALKRATAKAAAAGSGKPAKPADHPQPICEQLQRSQLDSGEEKPAPHV